MSALLELLDVSASYRGTAVLHAVSINVQGGRITTLLGANGAGKTTTLRAISNLLVQRSGDIRFDGKSILNLAPQSIARLGIAHVPDGRGTFVQMTVHENLQLGGFCHRDRAIVESQLGHVYGLFPQLKSRHRQQAGTLSGGEQQMLAIGRALMSRPKLMLLDEPSFGLAPRIVSGIFDTLKAIVEEQKVSVLLVEQNARLALDLAHDAYLLETGKVVLEGDCYSVKSDPAIRTAYLGL